jgi:hypothetical protein
LPTRRARLPVPEAFGRKLAQPVAVSLPAISKQMVVRRWIDRARQDQRVLACPLTVNPMQRAMEWLACY